MLATVKVWSSVGVPLIVTVPVGATAEVWLPCDAEAEVKESGRPYKKGSFPFAASGRAKAMEQTTGMVKIISAEDDDEVLGVHIVGPMAGELIAEAVLAMEFSASTEDIQRTIHAHPSLAEAVHEAALAVDKRALNYMN